MACHPGASLRHQSRRRPVPTENPDPTMLHWALLRISRRPASLTDHADRLSRALHSVGLRPATPSGAPDRERRAASSIGGLAATETWAPAVVARRPAVLDVAVPPVARMAAGAGHRQARYRSQVAPTRVSVLLALEESAARTRPAPHRARRPSAHPPDVPCQPATRDDGWRF